jgi:TRAP-type C4-dicarboxylate transport system permease small subunit
MDESGDIDRGNIVTRIIYYLSGLGLIAITFVIFYATIARYFFNNPPFWGEEIAILIFIWTGFLAAGMAIASGWNVRVDALTRLLPMRVADLLQVAMHLIVVFFLATLLYHSWDVFELSLYGKLEATRWPSAVLTAALPTGLFIMLCFQLVLLRRTMRRLRGPGADRAS